MNDIATGGITTQEAQFLESIVSNMNLFKFLTTQETIDLEYNSCNEENSSTSTEKLDYRSHMSTMITKYQEAHQTLRRIMSKSSVVLSNGQVAYTIVDDSEIPPGTQNGSVIVLGYKMLLLSPKYDIGKHKTLLELVFLAPVAVLPIKNGSFFIMNENHIFTVQGIERRFLEKHPSHDHKYHLDIYRLASLNEVKVPGDEDYNSRFRLRIRCKEKDKIILHSSIWKKSPEDKKRRGNEDDFEEFKRKINLSSALTDDTLHKLYLLSSGIKDLLVKILFKIHTHQLKVDLLVDQFYLKDVQNVSYADLQDKLRQTVLDISSDLDRFFTSSAPVSTNKFIIFIACTAKHLANMRPGSYVRFDNFLTGYTSTDYLVSKLAERSDEVILSVSLPPRTPLLLLPDPTRRSKFHNTVVLPRNMIFYIDEIKPIRIIQNPQTFRKTFLLRFSRFAGKEQQNPILGEGNEHFVLVNYENLEHISRNTISE